MTTITDPEALPSAYSRAIPGELSTVPHWRAGSPFAGESTRSSDVFDPATGRVTKHLALASPADADAVIAAAHAAWPAWRDMSLARRTQILFRFRENCSTSASTRRPRSSPASTERCSSTPSAR